MSQAKINKYIANDSYLAALAKECLKDAAVCPRKMLESVRELAATMFVIRVEEDTPLDNVQYDIGNIMKQDLHKLKASAIFDVRYQDVTSEQRRYAKTISFFNNYYQGEMNMQPGFLRPFKATHIVVERPEGGCDFPVGTLLERMVDNLYRDCDGVHEFIHEYSLNEIVKDK